MPADDVTLDDIRAARGRIAGGVVNSPCLESVPLSELTGLRVFCKIDAFQRTGSFKERGALNALLLLDAAAKERGVIAASAGNHALGLAFHGRRLGVPVAVVMPTFAPLVKSGTCRALGAEVILHGRTFGEAKARAYELATERGLSYVHGFDDPAVIAGQGTMGLEILEQVPDAAAVVVPVGGAGLLAGVATAVKGVRPGVKIIAAEAERAPNFSAALAAGRAVDVPARPTLADGLATGTVGPRAFAMARGKVDAVITVSEDAIALAVLRLLELEKTLVEGAAASSLAVCLDGRLTSEAGVAAGSTVVLCLCGGNIDPRVVGRVIDKALVADGRLCRFVATISDLPGGLAEFADLIGRSGASIKDLDHDRAFSGPDVASVNVHVTIETTGRPHLEELYGQLRAKGVHFRPA